MKLPRDDLARLAVENALPGLSVAVARDGEVVATGAWGEATTETAFLLASVTKPMTAAALLVCCERGDIDLDQPIDAYLPSDCRLTDWMDGPAPSVRDVAGHRAGLAPHARFFYRDEAFPVPAPHETVTRYGHVLRRAGARFCYSNLGYGLLDLIVPPHALEELVFRPLGLTSASFGPRYLGPNPVAPRRGADGVAYPDYDVDHRGAALAWMTAADLARFGAAFADGGPPLLSGDSIAAAWDAIPTGGARGSYGLGWEVATLADGSRLTGHPGGMGGVSTELRVVPEHSVAVAVCANRTAPIGGSPAVSRAARTLLAAALPDQAQAIQQPKGATVSNAPAPDAPSTGPNSFVGYAHVDGAAIPVTARRTQEGVQLRVGTYAELAFTPLPDEIADYLGNWPLGGIDLSGAISVPSNDARRYPHRAGVLLGEDGASLVGALIAAPSPEISEGGAPGHRLGDFLAYPLRLEPA